MDPWLLGQLADSAFPTGGFAHSGGLEAAAKLGRVEDAGAFLLFVEESLWQAGAFSLPFVRAALEDPGRLAELDARCDAATPGLVANRASRAQGTAFLRAAARLSPAVEALAEEAREGELTCHLAPAFGAALRRLGASEEEACHLFLFQTARGVVSAGVRLGLLGPLEAQELLARASGAAEEILTATRGRTFAEAAATSPLLDLLQSHQPRLYSRLFQS